MRKTVDKSENLNIRCEISERIKRIRKAQGITQEKMAELLGVSYNNYVRIENNKQNLTIYHLRNIAKILSVTTDVILFEDFGKENSTNLERYIGFAKTFDRELLETLKSNISNIIELQRLEEK